MNPIDKIRKLLSLGKNASDNEAVLALEMAARLMAKWGVDEIDLLLSEKSLDGLGGLQKEILYQSKRTAYWRTCLSHALSVANHCKALIVPGVGLIVYGHSGNIKKVRSLWSLLCPQIDAWAKRACAGKGRTYASSYRLGVVCTLQKRLLHNHHALIVEREEEAQTALVVVSAKIVDDVSAFVQSQVGDCDPYKNAVRKWSTPGYICGKKDGEKMDADSRGEKMIP